MPTQPTLGMNPMLALLPPDQQQNLMQLQQQQAIGQALLQQGLQPIDTSNRQVAGMGYRISPLEGLAKMANMYVGNKIARDSMGQQAQIMGQMYGNAFGGQPQAPQAAPTDAGGISGGQSGPGVVSSPIATPGAADLGAAMGGGTQVGPQTQMANGVLTMPGKTPQQSMILFSMLGPDAYAKMLQAQTAPTAATLAARQGGFDQAAANQLQFRKDSYVAPLTGTGIMRNPFNPSQPVAFNPEVPAGATPMFDASGNVVAEKSIPGAQGVMQGNAAATAAGGAQFKPVQVYNPQTHQMEYSNEVAVTNPSTGRGGGAAPTLSGIFAQQESSGGKTAPDNPMQIQQGTFKQYAQPGESWSNPADRTAVANRVLGTYQQKYGGDLGRIATAYFSGEGNVAPAGSPTPYLRNVSDANGKSVASYVGDIQSRAGSSSGGASAAAPPLGATSNANASQQASADTMKVSYEKLQGINSTANGALDALQKMQALAARKNPVLTAGALGTMVAPTISPDAAEYEKQRANVVQLLAGQNGTNGSDKGRELTGESVPDYGKPNKAIQDGLQTQINQLRAQQLKANLLTPVYQSGDSKAYTTLENGFDQAIKPSMMPVLSLSGDAQRAAVQSAIKANPALRSNFEWAFHNGLLK
jgi:hypothetical protein